MLELSFLFYFFLIFPLIVVLFFSVIVSLIKDRTNTPKNQVQNQIAARNFSVAAHKHFSRNENPDLPGISIYRGESLSPGNKLYI